MHNFVLSGKENIWACLVAGTTAVAVPEVNSWQVH